MTFMIFLTFWALLLYVLFRRRFISMTEYKVINVEMCQVPTNHSKLEKRVLIVSKSGRYIWCRANESVFLSEKNVGDKVELTEHDIGKVIVIQYYG